MTPHGSVVPGVIVVANNGGGTTATNSAGFYGLQVPYGWTGTVTTCKDGWQFVPEYRSYENLISDQGNQSYSARLIYDIDPPGQGDDYVGVGDLSRLATSWLQSVPPADGMHDFDCDGVVNEDDLILFASAWLKGAFEATFVVAECHACVP